MPGKSISSVRGVPQPFLLERPLSVDAEAQTAMGPGTRWKPLGTGVLPSE